MSDFKAKMHQNRFRLVPHSWVYRGLLVREGDMGREGERGERKGNM